jgi:hypothetical protein
MMAAVPALLKQMRATDFLPAPCLNGSSAAVEKDSDDEGGMDDDKNVDSEALNLKLMKKWKNDESEGEEDNGEEEEVEEEEEEEENHNALEPICAEDMEVPANQHLDFDTTYRVNPLVKVVTSTDIRCFERGSSVSKDALSSSEAFIVHSGFGNETFESVLRQVVIVPEIMVPAAKVLMNIIAEHQVARQRFFGSIEVARMRGPELKRKRGEPANDTPSWDSVEALSVGSLWRKCSDKSVDTKIPGQLVQAFVAAGALTTMC